MHCGLRNEIPARKVDLTTNTLVDSSSDIFPVNVNNIILYFFAKNQANMKEYASMGDHAHMESPCGD